MTKVLFKTERNNKEYKFTQCLWSEETDITKVMWSEEPGMTNVLFNI